MTNDGSSIKITFLISYILLFFDVLGYENIFSTVLLHCSKNKLNMYNFLYKIIVRVRYCVGDESWILILCLSSKGMKQQLKSSLSYLAVQSICFSSL